MRFEDLTDDDFKSLERIAAVCWQTAEDKGWHKDEKFRELVETALEHLKSMPSMEAAAIPLSVQQVLIEVEKQTRLANGVPVPQQLMLVVSEASEALEAFRDPNMNPQHKYIADATSTTGIRGEGEPYYADHVDGAKPEGVASEMADILIRVLDISLRAGIPTLEVMRQKMAYNLKRSHRHGGKRI